ncbi:MAG: DNA alkylation repair protein [Anaerolineae bacterium]
MAFQEERVQLLERLHACGEASQVAAVRRVTRDWQRAHPDVSLETLFALVEALWDGGSRVERLAALHLLARYPCHITALTWAHFERWRHDLKDRSVADTLARHVFAPWLLANPAHRFGHLWNRLLLGDRWSRRLALVATVGLNRAHPGVGHPGVTLFLVDQVWDAREPLVQEALAWALRVLAEEDSALVRDYVAHHVTLSSITLPTVERKR